MYDQGILETPISKGDHFFKLFENHRCKGPPLLKYPNFRLFSPGWRFSPDFGGSRFSPGFGSRRFSGGGGGGFSQMVGMLFSKGVFSPG